MLAGLGGVEQRADPARVLDRRGWHAELAGEARREMAVAREAELECQCAQVGVVLGQPLERRAQAEGLPVTGEREAGLGTEDAREVEGRGVELAGELAERPPHREVGGELRLGRLRELAVVGSRTRASRPSPNEMWREHRQHEPGGELLGLELVRQAAAQLADEQMLKQVRALAGRDVRYPEGAATGQLL